MASGPVCGQTHEGSARLATPWSPFEHYMTSTSDCLLSKQPACVLCCRYKVGDAAEEEAGQLMNGERGRDGHPDTATKRAVGFSKGKQPPPQKQATERRVVTGAGEVSP